MLKALIGHTGFVGGNLVRQVAFDDFYNSKNIEDIAGRAYDLLVCAGAPAEKWKANQQPTQDLQTIERLIACLGRAKSAKCILISTVDVYPNPVDVDEGSPIATDEASPYGKHRLLLESFVKDHFYSLIVRLPGLFGAGLKKNIIYDFLHDNGVDRIHSESVFQFYDLSNLWKDIERSLGHALALVNFATEPVSVGQIAREAFGMAFENRPASKPARYDFRTKYDRMFGGPRGYFYSQQQVLEAMRRFVASERGSAP